MIFGFAWHVGGNGSEVLGLRLVHRLSELDVGRPEPPGVGQLQRDSSAAAGSSSFQGANVSRARNRQGIGRDRRTNRDCRGWRRPAALIGGRDRETPRDRVAGLSTGDTTQSKKIS